MNIPSFEDYLTRIKTNLWLMGIPYGNPKSTSISIRFYALSTQLFIMLCLETAFFVSRIAPENFLELTQLFPCLCSGILTGLKTGWMRVQRNKIYELTERLKERYGDVTSNPENIKLVRKDLILVDKFANYYFKLNIVVISLYNFSTPILMAYIYFTKKEVLFLLPFAVLLPFSTDAWLPWFFMWVYSITCGYFCIVTFTSADMLYFVLTSHVCAHNSVISNIIAKLDKDNVSQLPNIVKEHQYMYKLGGDLEDIFTMTNLFTMMAGSLEICALGFNITMGSWAQLPGCILFLSSTVIRIFMMSVFGENLLQESGKICDAAFLCKWYEMDERSKKTILTIMIRAIKPQELTAYKFSVVSYASFSKIISTSWSYFTILRTVYTPPE